VFLAVVPFLSLFAIVYAKLIQPRTTRQLNLINQCSVTASECFFNLRTVKLYNMEGEEIRRFKHANRNYYVVAVQNYILGMLLWMWLLVRWRGGDGGRVWRMAQAR
jgi:ABC-type multidrug transport system fused ATPase/permease subunit